MTGDTKKRMSDLEGFLLALGLILFIMICIGFWDTYKNEKKIRKWLIKEYHHHFSGPDNNFYRVQKCPDSAIIIIYEGEQNLYQYNFPFKVIYFQINRDNLSNVLAEFYKLQSNASYKILYIIGKGFCGWLAIRAAQFLKYKYCPKFLRLLAIEPEKVTTYSQTFDDKGFERHDGSASIDGHSRDDDNWVVYSDDPDIIFGNVAPVVPINQNSDTQILDTFFNRFNRVAIVITTKDNLLQSLVRPYVSQIIEFEFPSKNLSNCLTEFKKTYNELKTKFELPIAVIGHDIGGWFAIRAAQFICSEILVYSVVHVMAVDPYSSEDCTCQYEYNDDNEKNGFGFYPQQKYPLLAKNPKPVTYELQITPVNPTHWHVYSDNDTTAKCYDVVATVHPESNTMYQDFFAQVKEEKNVDQ